jgi:hypothetical protein
MKQLHEYDTPETDKAEYTVRLGTHKRNVVRPELSRNLEQRLAACRDALEAAQSCDSYDPISVEIMQDKAREALTLTLTAPKQ